MNDYTYIVFGISGISFSKIIKEKNSNINVIHFCDRYYTEFSLADVKIYLDDVLQDCIVYSYARYDNLENNDSFNCKIDDVLKMVKK